MLIGEVSELVGLSPKTIRYYEAEGVIPAVERQANGYRTYGELEVRRLQMVAAARALDLPLKDISDLSDLLSAGRPPCARLRSVAEQRRSMVRRMIRELHIVEERLTEPSRSRPTPPTQQRPRHTPAVPFSRPPRRISHSRVGVMRPD